MSHKENTIILKRGKYLPIVQGTKRFTKRLRRYLAGPNDPAFGAAAYDPPQKPPDSTCPLPPVFHLNSPNLTLPRITWASELLEFIKTLPRPVRLAKPKGVPRSFAPEVDVRKSLLHHIPSEQGVSVPKNTQTLTYPIPLSPSKMPQINLPSDPASAESLPVRSTRPSDEGGQNTAHAHAQTATDRRIDPLEPSILNPRKPLSVSPTEVRNRGHQTGIKRAKRAKERAVKTLSSTKSEKGRDTRARPGLDLLLCAAISNCCLEACALLPSVAAFRACAARIDMSPPMSRLRLSKQLSIDLSLLLLLLFSGIGIIMLQRVDSLITTTQAMPRPHRRDRKSFLLQPHGPRDPTTAGRPPVPQSTSAVRIRRVCRSVAYRPLLPVASIAESGIAPPSLSGTKPHLFAG
ncbi:hypothetical protein CSIM01_11786 [Colletotrichum simmondsii]|uniref:Uncharacterized protein n=1 Tax=Colletotrichum simmondsii TaxID=703756 RepID=A0A135SF74_9PEZI|nr:hypothetical protein CSIM01_11786 [Colletotrichum simmondsii]